MKKPLPLLILALVSIIFFFSISVPIFAVEYGGDVYVDGGQRVGPWSLDSEQV